MGYGISRTCIKKKIINLQRQNKTGRDFYGNLITVQDKEYVVHFSQNINLIERKFAMLFLHENIYLTPEVIMNFNLMEQTIFERMDIIKAQYQKEIQENLNKK